MSSFGDYYVSPITAETVVAEIDRKLRTLRSAPGEADGHEIRTLEEERVRWQQEEERVQLEQIAHAARQAEVHRGLANEHARRYRPLLKQRRHARGEGGLCTA